MGYLHIENLYRPEAQVLLNLRDCYVTEKCHGTSAHIGWSGVGDDGRPHSNRITYFSGGESHERFKALFDEEKLKAGFTTLGHPKVTVYGEAYGGKQQGMSETYGKALAFIVFDVQVGDTWLSVPDAQQIAEGILGLEFVPYKRVACEIAILDTERDKPSEIAVRRGITEPRPREGIVIRPLVEMSTNRGRLIAKHKGAAFVERQNQPKVQDASRAAVLAEAQAIADEWVTPRRLSNIISHLDKTVLGLSSTADIIKLMIADVEREAAGEIVVSENARRAIGKRAAQLFHVWLRGGSESIQR